MNARTFELKEIFPNCKILCCKWMLPTRFGITPVDSYDFVRAGVCGVTLYRN